MNDPEVKNEFQGKLKKEILWNISSKRNLSLKASTMYWLDKEEHKHLLVRRVLERVQRNNAEPRINWDGIKHT